MELKVLFKVLTLEDHKLYIDALFKLSNKKIIILVTQTYLFGYGIWQSSDFYVAKVKQ